MTAFVIAGVGCGVNTTAYNCNDHSNSFAAVGYLIVALIVVLAIFDLVWKFRSGSPGPISRAAIRFASALTRGGKRS
jgi:hypothetical protein